MLSLPLANITLSSSLQLVQLPGLPQDRGHLEMLTAGHGSVPWSKAKGSHSYTVQVLTERGGDPDADRYQDCLVIQQENSQNENSGSGHICVPKGQHGTQSSHPSPGTSGTRDAGSPCGSEAGFPHFACPACLPPGWKSQPLLRSA